MNKKTAVLPLRRPNPRAIPATLEAHSAIGAIARVDADGSILVSLPGMSAIPARLATALDMEQLRSACTSQQPAVLVFEDGDRNKPIVIGLVAAPTPTTQKQDAPQIEADVDGRRVKLTAKDEIVLECGQASITLRRNGRVVIRGTHIESDSDGTNRIKGGQVRIN